MRHCIVKITVVLIVCLISGLAFTDERITLYSQNDKPREAFILFYMASCPHCQRFDPVLKTYAKQHGIPVLAYTLDGQSLPSFPKSIIPTPAELNRFFPNGSPVVPTLFLMDFNQHKIIPVLKGEASTVQVDRRMQEIHRMGGVDE